MYRKIYHQNAAYRLKVNIKNNFILFCSGNKRIDNQSININNTKIEQIMNSKLFLGVITDKLKWNERTQTNFCKILKNIGAFLTLEIIYIKLC